MEELTEICLHIGDHVFTVKKHKLCKHSDYFQAMFSGNYVEKDQRDITIDVDAVDANSMSIIVCFFEEDRIDMSKHDLSVTSRLATAAIFLQITEVIKQITQYLDLQLAHNNWVEIMTLAQKVALVKLEQSAAAYGLLNFKTMEVKHIPSVEKLFWYLSHPYLDTDNEMDVFQFGSQWVLCNETGADALLIILGCLDMKQLTTTDLNEIRDEIVKHYTTKSLAVKVVECLLNLRDSKVLSLSNVIIEKDSLCKLFTVRVYFEVLNLVKECRERCLTYTPTITLYIPNELETDDDGPYFLYKFSKEKGFEKWLEVGAKHYWGYSVAAWGATKIVVVGGEFGRGTGVFMRDVKVYDILKKEWIYHKVELPKRRHGSVAILGDTMFFIGGVGAYRIVLDTGITYDMKLKSFKVIPRLPGSVQSPAICAHKGGIYASVARYHIDKLIDGEKDQYLSWIPVVTTVIQYDKMVSFKDYVYCTQNHDCALSRFMPGVDESLQLVTSFLHPTAALCSLKDRIIVVTRPMIMVEGFIAIEELKEDHNEHFKRSTWQSTIPFFRRDDVSSCAFVFEIPPLNKYVSSYHLKYINKYIMYS